MKHLMTNVDPVTAVKPVTVTGKDGKLTVWAVNTDDGGLAPLKPAPGSRDYPGSIGGRTDKYGTARFLMGSTRPPSLRVDADFPGEVDYCSPPGGNIFRTDQVLKTGVVAQNI